MVVTELRYYQRTLADKSSQRRRTVAQLRRAVAKHAGNVHRAARSLRTSDAHLLRLLRRRDLVGFLHDVRSRHRDSTMKATRAALVKHAGNATRAAESLGIRPSTMGRRILVFGLQKLVETLRPRRLGATEERTRLLELIQRHHGRISSLSATLGFSRNTVLARLRKYDLIEETDAARVAAGIPGPRTRLPQGRDREERRAKLIAMLVSCNWKVERASRLAGVSVMTMYARMRDLRIDRVEGLQQHRFHQVVDALRASNGIVARAARQLDVTEKTFSRWAKEFELDPRSFRR